MLRKTLLVTTALVLGASVAYAKGYTPKNNPAQQKLLAHASHVVNGQAVIVHTTAKSKNPVHNHAPNLFAAVYNNYSRDANAQYISWYGFNATNISSTYSSPSGYHDKFHDVSENAVGFTPAATVTTKKVSVPMFSFFASATYVVDIYSSSGGVPGNVLATSKSFSDSDTGICCGQSRTVALKANLTGGTPYFIGIHANTGGEGGWNMEDTDLTGALVDYWHYTETGSYGYTANEHYTFHYSSPWHASTIYPETGAVTLK